MSWLRDGQVLGLGWGWDVAADGSVGAVGPAEPSAGVPSPVLRGVKPHGDVEVNVDWVNLTGSTVAVEGVRRLLQEAFGGVVEVQKGFHFYGEAETFKGGAILLTDHLSGDSCMVQLSGDVCELLGSDLVLRLVGDLRSLGMEASRFDVCVDHRAAEGERVDLVEGVTALCKRGCLVGAKRFKPHEEFQGDGECVNLGLEIGKRGSYGSGRYVRVYDKGLESGEGPRGSWQRWETEFHGDCADSVACALVHAARCGDWRREALGMAYGSVDFREGDRHQTVSRRPRVAAWAAVLAGLAVVRIKRAARRTSGAALKRACARAVGGTAFALSKILNKPLEEVLLLLVDARDVSEACVAAAVNRPQVHQLAAIISPGWGGDLPIVKQSRRLL